MSTDDAANNPTRQSASESAAPDQLMDAGDGYGGDDWLGCEALHPLTWLPSPAAALPA